MRIFLSAILTSLFVSLPLAASADVITERQANFSASGKSLRMIGGAIGEGNFAFIEAEAAKLAKWADMMPEFFPAGSESPKASPDIWNEFEQFTQLSADFGAAARALGDAAASKDASLVKAKLGEVGQTCKSCHWRYRSR